MIIHVICTCIHVHIQVYTYVVMSSSRDGLHHAATVAVMVAVAVTVVVVSESAVEAMLAELTACARPCLWLGSEDHRGDQRRSSNGQCLLLSSRPWGLEVLKGVELLGEMQDLPQFTMYFYILGHST